MFKILLRSRFDAFWASFSGADNKNKKKRSPVVTGLLIALFAFLAIYLMFAFGMMCFGMDLLARETGDMWVSQTLSSMIASLLCVVGSVFTAKTQIFESKDNELLLAMPIEPKYIFLSRMTMLLIVNYALEALVMLPAIGVHAVVVGYGFVEALFTILVFLLLPFFTLTISTLVAWVISIISSKLRNKTFINVLFTVLFLVIYFIACGAFGGFVGSGAEGTVDLTGLKNTFVFYWMGSAMGEGNALGMLFFTLCTIIPASITFYLLNRSFVKIITTVRGAKKIAYKEKSEKTSSPFMALFKKELRRFFTSSAYILNAGMGNIMTVIIAVMVAFVAPDILVELESEPIIAQIVPTACAIMIAFMASMNLVSAPSISLEDKNLWILQCSPISSKAVLMAKLLTHITVCAPLTIISVVIVSIAIKMSVLNAIFAIIMSISVVAFTGYLGLTLGLKFPKFNWQNETVAVKQGFAVFGTMFGSMIWTMIFFFVGMVLAILGVELWIIELIITLANALVCALLHLYLVKGGAKRFASLQK
ncbi:MAG: hypothetical protein IKA43_00040 [Clostridia bacterium]|nr:hypothetical protein [Clostridia bacterium]